MGLLRLLLALAVVAAHAGPPFGIAGLQLTGGPLAVQVFYAISGFYMALVLQEKYTGPGHWARFVQSRLWRLLPMYFAVLAATLLLGWLVRAATGADLAPFAAWRAHGAAMPWSDRLGFALAHLTLVGQDWLCFAAVEPSTGALYATADFHREALPAWQFLLVPQAWTVGVELCFYAIAPFVVRRRAPWLALLLLMSLVLRFWLRRGLGLYTDPWSYRFFPTELALFLGGALAYRLYRWLDARRWLGAWPCRGATALLLLLVLGYGWLPVLAERSLLGLPALLYVVPWLLPFAFHATRHAAFDRQLGELSYPVYLVHYLLVFVVDAIGQPWLAAHRGVVLLVASLAAGYLLWRLVGAPLEARRSRFGGAAATGTAPAAPAALPR